MEQLYIIFRTYSRNCLMKVQRFFSLNVLWLFFSNSAQEKLKVHPKGRQANEPGSQGQIKQMVLNGNTTFCR